MPTSREPNREKRRIKSRRGNTVSIPAASTIHPPASTGTVRWGREGGVLKTVETECAGCGVRFLKSKKEYERQRRKAPGRRFFCSRRCYASSAGKGNLGSHLGVGNAAHLDPANRGDEHSPFRYFMNKARNRPVENDLDLPYLKALWEKQAGRCAVSGLPPVLPPNTAAYDRMTREPLKASLDRIDQARGYVRGNVRFVTLIANLARNRFTDEQMIAFCEAVVRHQRG